MIKIADLSAHFAYVVQQDAGEALNQLLQRIDKERCAEVSHALSDVSQPTAAASSPGSAAYL